MGNNRYNGIEIAGHKRTALLFCLLSFLFPFLLLMVAMLAMRIEPFGAHNLAISDGRSYLQSLMTFGRRIKEGESLLYSLGGLGVNLWSSMSWGGYNLGSILSLFATWETAPTWYSWIVLSNMSLCGLSMYLLLAKIDGHRLSHLVFSTSYALMGFNVAYCYHFIFFIGPQLLPLMILGLVRMLEGKSPLLYILSLGACIFLNFYFGFMLCVASVAFFMARFIGEGRTLSGKRLRLFGVYSVSSLIAGLLPALMWLPALKAFSDGGRLDQTVLSDFFAPDKTTLLQTFSKLFSGALSITEETDGLPNIFCGILAVGLALLYFFNRRGSVRRKRTAGAVMAFYMVTFCVPALTLLMHGGTVTNWFPYRYSFVFSFFVICLAFETSRHLDEIDWADIKRCFTVMIISTVVVFYAPYDYISSKTVLIDVVLLALIVVGYWFWQSHPQRLSKRLSTLLLTAIVSINLLLNFTLSITSLRDWEMDVDAYQDNVLNSGAITQALKEWDTSFYRMEKNKQLLDSCSTDAEQFGYCGVCGSGPAIRWFVHKGASRIGLNWFDMRHWYEAGIPSATDALLGLKYLIASEDLENEKAYRLLLDLGVDKIYQNPNALSLAILANDAVGVLSLGANAFENLNDIWKAMAGGAEDVFYMEDDVTFTLHNNTDGQVATSAELRAIASDSEAEQQSDNTDKAYIEYSFTAQRDGAVYRFDSSVPESEVGKILPSMVCCGVYRAGDTVTGVCTTNAEYLPPKTFMDYCSTLVFAYADNDVLAEYAERLNSRDCTLDVIQSHDLTGTFTAEANQRLLFTLAWDEGWTCYIDGQPVSIDKTWDLFMSVSVPEGQHTYEMKFFPAWMNYGITISCATLVGLIAFMTAWHMRRKKQSEAGA